MARRCFLSGKGPKVVNNVSHANNRTKRRQFPNLQTVRVYDPETGTYRRRRVSVRMMRTLDKKGLLMRVPVQPSAEEA
ncbi:MAG: 50S ribosomal protein L28 [Candidatus Poribacteria bacterium]|nr:MAG: 50S ribosomal protein L28 [Candidatus Poribacteria bacterium]